MARRKANQNYGCINIDKQRVEFGSIATLRLCMRKLREKAGEMKHLIQQYTNTIPKLHKNRDGREKNTHIETGTQGSTNALPGY